MIIKFIKIILAFIFTYFIFYISLYSIAFYNEQFYKEQFKKSEIYNKFQNIDINKINQNVISYLNNNENSLRSTFFNEKEVKHLKDVRDLFLVFYKIFKLLFIIFILLISILYLYTPNIKSFIFEVFSSLLTSSILSISFIFLLAVCILFDFDSIFIQMHNIFFKPETWTFNFDDNIVNLYTEDFFYNISMYLVKTILIICSAIALLSIFIKKLLK